ncbi:MAG: hypothetical protein C0391_06730 [Anaerolinea sp.]|nr:hypothetical protein [Anaerolinea sp.]
MPTRTSRTNLRELEPLLTASELKTVFDNLLAGTQELANDVELLENLFQQITGVKHAIAVSSGAAAMHLGLRVARMQAADVAILSPLTTIPVISALLQENIIPVFVDVDRISGCLNADSISQTASDMNASVKLSRRWLPRKGCEKIGHLKAVILQHGLAQPGYVDKVKIALPDQMMLLGDFSQTLGIIGNGMAVGTLADLAIYSFQMGQGFPNVTCGMLTTNHEGHAEQLHILRNQGCQLEQNEDRMIQPGFNYSAGRIQAALWNAHLLHVDTFQNQCQKIANWYEQRLMEIQVINVHPAYTYRGQAIRPEMVVSLDESLNRQELLEELEILGVLAQPHGLPAHLQPIMIERFGYREGDYPAAEDLCSKSISLPFSQRMTERQVDIVCRILAQILV